VKEHAIVTTVLAGLLTSACATVGPNYSTPTPANLAVPDTYANAGPTAPDAAELQHWWTRCPRHE